MNTQTDSQPHPRLTARFIEPVSNYADIIQQQVDQARAGVASAFKVRAQLLDQGRSETVLAASNQLTLRLKVYASGGENTLHTHVNEDHLFVLLQGSADFFDEEGLMASLSAHQGVVLPKGTRYRFIATSSQPLVMLRVGSPNEAALGLEGRVDSVGKPADPQAPENKNVAPIFKPNAYFG